MTKHRNALVVLLVAALAATSITPTIARPNTGAFEKSSEGFKKGQQTVDACRDLKDLVNDLRDQGTSKASKEAAEWKSAAQSFGCGWAR